MGIGKHYGWYKKFRKTESKSVEILSSINHGLMKNVLDF